MTTPQTTDPLLRERGMTEAVVPRRRAGHPPRSLRERQRMLLVLCAGILITTIDGSATYVALPSIQDDLGFSSANLAWVVNAFLIPFGGLLLFAGRLGDLVGQRRVFVGGLGVFTAASLGCGLIESQVGLIAMRFLQGVGAALATAVVLSMIVTMFPHPREQARAISLYGFIAASAAAIGLLVGAVLTEALGWHWIFFVNVPIGVLTIAATLRIVDEVRDTRHPSRLDAVGAVALVAALMLTVYTIVQAGTDGWGTLTTVLLGGGSLVLLAGFAAWQSRTRDPLVPPKLVRSRNVVPSNVVLAAMVAGPTGMFFLTGLYMQSVLGYDPLQLGLAFLPVAVAVGVGSLKAAPRLLRENDAKLVLIPAMVLIVVGLAVLARIPDHGNYFIDILPAILLLGIGSGLATPALLGIALAEATESDSGVRSGLVNMTQQVGAALGLAVMAPIAASATKSAVGDGQPLGEALAHGYRIGFLVGAGITVLGLIYAIFVLERETPRTAPDLLDQTKAERVVKPHNPAGVADADFVALGLGGTSMMSMLWSIAMGKRAVGIELRGGPYFAVMQWSMPEDIYHHLALIDRMIAERYGSDRVPLRGDGTPFLLADCLYSAAREGGGDARADEVITGWSADSYIAGPIEMTEHIDDRYVDGKPHRTIRRTGAVEVPSDFDPSRVGRGMDEVIADGPTFLIGAEELLLLVRRYLEEIEKMDMAAGVQPRCRILLYHRAVTSDAPRVTTWLRRRTHIGHVEEGFIREADGRVRIRVESIRELDDKQTYRRIREPGSEIIDLGVPELFMVAEGAGSDDAARLGFKQEPVRIDRNDGRGPVPVETDYVIGVTGALMDNVLRYRIASEFDGEGNEYWVRQTGIGHEGLADTAWFVCEVPPFMTFDPVLAGMLPRGTVRGTKKYYGAYLHLIRHFFLEQMELMTELPKSELAELLQFFGPRLVSVVSKTGNDPLVARNGVVAGDSFGNGSMLNSYGGITGMVGHAARTLTYWRAREAGVEADDAIRTMADQIRQDTEIWLRATEQDYAQPAGTYDHGALDTIRKRRRGIAPVVYRDDWSRLNTHPGRLWTDKLPPLGDTHPDSVLDPTAGSKAPADVAEPDAVAHAETVEDPRVGAVA